MTQERQVFFITRKKLLEMSVLLDHPVQLLNHAGLFFVMHFSAVWSPLDFSDMKWSTQTSEDLHAACIRKVFLNLTSISSPVSAKYFPLS